MLNIPQLLKFLTDLHNNNNKEWFAEHKNQYQLLRNGFTDLVSDIVMSITKYDNSLDIQDPKKYLFRINRDLRFTKDKRPYKTAMSAAISQFKKDVGPTYYFEINYTAKLLTGGGIYSPSPQEIQKIRQDISNNPEEINKALTAKDFIKSKQKLTEDKLKSAPKGFLKTDPQIELLKLKRFSVHKEINIANFTEEELQVEISQNLKGVFPLITYLRRVIN